MKSVQINCPSFWRKGQTLFNFLEWVAEQRPELINQAGDRLADPFYLTDKEFDDLVDQFEGELERGT